MRLGLSVDAFVLLLKTEHETSVEEGIVVGLANIWKGGDQGKVTKQAWRLDCHRVSPETPAAL